MNTRPFTRLGEDRETRALLPDLAKPNGCWAGSEGQG